VILYTISNQSPRRSSDAWTFDG